ncbi:MAG: hypothetical protein BWY83_03388 [bacterium ADurb.Bin478]|nr:MAG: hypothetical protein BWY83_03388 [bacterium ADurb.Bin478]
MGRLLTSATAWFSICVLPAKRSISMVRSSVDKASPGLNSVTSAMPMITEIAETINV